jgi:phage-related minor tail protein
MSVEAATQLAVLGDKVQMMTTQGQDLSDEDRAAVTQSALSIAGITSDDVNQALQHAVAGDNTATDALIEKAAQNLGMPSSESLRNQLLPALGVQLQ